MRMVVDLPAPFGPRKPSTSPRSTVNETSLTASFGPESLRQVLNFYQRLLLNCRAVVSRASCIQNQVVGEAIRAARRLDRSAPPSSWFVRCTSSTGAYLTIAGAE